MKEQYYKNIQDKINSIIIYKNVINNKIINLIFKLCNLDSIEETFSYLSKHLIENAEKNGFKGNLIKNYIFNLFLKDDNIFTIYCENNMDIKNSSLYNIALNDICIMKDLSNFNLNGLDIKNKALDEILNYTPINKTISQPYTDMLNITVPNDILLSFISYYKNYGCGNISEYKMFKFDSNFKLLGIKNYDLITFNDIIGYKTQKETLIKNTMAFLNGYQANNVLLVGARGTGKSSSVKALANEYFEKGLRLVEITKEQIMSLPKILNTLKNRGKKFIIYIDDLSFDENEIQYKHMKSLLEGSSESKPYNVLFYATSNRRHLIQEKWNDRSSGSLEAEIHTTDTLNEKLSLADRFGITITYPKPNPKEYIEIVQAIALKENLNISKDTLEKEALKWELNQKGLSGRTAKQFINNIIWEQGYAK